MWRLAALALLVVLMGVTGVREVSAGSYLLVDTTSDAVLVDCYDQNPLDQDCSLRGAIIVSNSIAASKHIIFVLGSGVPEITPTYPLPDITQPVSIEGATGGTQAVEITGDAAAPGSDGLRLVDHHGSTIEHLYINGWRENNDGVGGDGIEISGGGSHKINSNIIGRDPLVGIAQPNQTGIRVTADGVTIGEVATPNTISGNSGDGVVITGNNNQLLSNYIGVNSTGVTQIGNGGNGVTISGFGNTVGEQGATTIIAGNSSGAGVRIDSGGLNIVRNSHIGLNTNGNAFPNLDGVVLLSPSNSIGGNDQRANVISGNTGSGVIVSDEGNAVSHNRIGTSPDGLTAVPQGVAGIKVIHVDNNLDEAAPAGGGDGTQISNNLISGNSQDGIHLDVVTSVVVIGNDIGVTLNRAGPLPNGSNGIRVSGGFSNHIGDLDEGEGNFIAANAGAGILTESVLEFAGEPVGPQGITFGSVDLINNWIGGTATLPGNNDGIFLQTDENDIGPGNTIVKNTASGITMLGSSSNLVAGNFIGTDSGGANLGNGLSGIQIGGNSNQIGGFFGFTPQDAVIQGGPRGPNVIKFNGGPGVFVEVGSEVNTIIENSIIQNTGGGIDLAPEGPTPNDTDDPDTGANNVQNFPVVTLAYDGQFGPGITGGTGSYVEASLNSIPDTEFLLQFFVSQTCASGVPREGDVYIGGALVTTNGNGNGEFSGNLETFATAGSYVTATATHADGSTSEFSECTEVTDTPDTTPTPTPGSPTATPSATPSPTATPVPTDVLGDADCDEDVDLDDMIAVLSEDAGVPPGAPCPDNANADCEFGIDARDALAILLNVADPQEFPLAC